MLPTHDASKVKASGPGLNTTGVPASLPVEFTIDAKDAGEGLLAVQITVSWLSQRLPGPAELPIQAQGREGRGGEGLRPEHCAIWFMQLGQYTSPLGAVSARAGLLPLG